MANHDWVDSRIAGLSPDREWVPDADRVLSRLRVRHRARAVTARRWMWTSVAATAIYMTLFLFPASRACAEEPGPCVLQAFSVTRVTVEVDPAFRTAFEQGVLPGLAEKYLLPGKVKLIYGVESGRGAVVIRCKGKTRLMAETSATSGALMKELDACLT